MPFGIGPITLTPPPEPPLTSNHPFPRPLIPGIGPITTAGLPTTPAGWAALQAALQAHSQSNAPFLGSGTSFGDLSGFGFGPGAGPFESIPSQQFFGNIPGFGEEVAAPWDYSTPSAAFSTRHPVAQPTPWETQDFSTPSAPDLGISDLFSLAETALPLFL